ncbi:MAG: DHHA1 domain-containing protein, partial [Myxococcales bacterium]
QSLAQGGATALLAAVEEGRAHLVFARPKGSKGPAMGDLLKDALAVLGGKGGGGPDFAQGSGAPANLDDALSRAAHKLAHP